MSDHDQGNKSPSADPGESGSSVSSETREVLDELLHDIHADLERRENIESHFTTRLKWGVMLAGLLALIAGVLMFRLIDQMDDHMQSMAIVMQQMGHQLGAMQHAVVKIGDDTQQIVSGLHGIQVSMDNIQRPMQVLPPMQKDVASMADNMAAMRAQVGHIAGNTSVMQRPFNFMP